MTKSNDNSLPNGRNLESEEIVNDSKQTKSDRSRPISQNPSCDEFDSIPNRFASIVSLNDLSPPVRIGKWYKFYSMIHKIVE